MCLADAIVDLQNTLKANPPASVDSPSLVTPASDFTGTLQFLPLAAISSLSSESYGQRDLTLPHATFCNLFTACVAMVFQCLKWDAAHEAATLSLQQAETGRVLSDEIKVYLTWEMMRVVQVGQGQVSMVRINRFSLEFKAEWVGIWNQMATTLPPNLENSRAEYNKVEGYVQPLDAGDDKSEMESED
jgi:hypothetical protein